MRYFVGAGTMQGTTAYSSQTSAQNVRNARILDHVKTSIVQDQGTVEQMY